MHISKNCCTFALRNPFVKVSIDGIDYHLQQDFGSYATVWASDTDEPHVSGAVTIPSSFTHEGVYYIVQGVTYYWEMENSITKLVLPIGVDTIDNSSFFFTKTLKEVDIPYVKYIGNHAFSYCSIEKLTLSSPYLKYLGEGAFSSNKAMTKLTITAPNLKELPDFAFAVCEKLADITLSPYLNKLGRQVFALNPALKTITLPSGINQLGDELFYDDTNLREIKVLAANPPKATAKTFDGIDKSKVKVIVPAGTYEAYKNATGWKNMNITDGIQAIDEVTNDQMRKCENVKILRNGQLLINRNGRTYTVTGQEIQ